MQIDGLLVKAQKNKNINVKSRMIIYNFKDF